jgi:uncharacterized protein YyaL (SSP411 family)
MKEDYDGAEPAASSIGALNLLSLAHLTGDHKYRSQAEEVFGAFSSRLSSYGRTLPMMASALAVALSPPEQIVIVVPEGGDDRLWQAANRRFRPFAQVIRVRPGAHQEALAARLPWIATMAAHEGEPTAYICSDFVCERPTTDAARLA